MMLLISITCFLQNCKKGSDAPTTPNEDNSFLNTTNYMFRGTFPDSSFLWKYGVFDFQRGAGAINLGSNENNIKSLTFDLVANWDLSTRIDITTPSYDASSEELFSKTLAVGDKQLGSRYSQFELVLTLNKTRYTTSGDQTNSLFKILKTEKSKDEFQRDIVLVWFKVNCKFYSTVDASSFVLKDGYLLAGFTYNL